MKLIIGILLIVCGCSTGFFIPYPISIIFSITFGFAGGHLIALYFIEK